MRRFHFHIQEKLITPVEVLAENEQEARERIFYSNQFVTVFDTERGEIVVVLRSTEDE